jgi:hypothetical protein
MEKRLKSCLWAVAEANQKRSLITFEPDLRTVRAIARVLGRKARSSETSELNTIGTAHSVDFISQGLSLLFSFLFSLCPMLLAVYGVRYPPADSIAGAGVQRRSSSCKCHRPTPKRSCFSGRVMGQHLGRSRILELSEP